MGASGGDLTRSRVQSLTAARLGTLVAFAFGALVTAAIFISPSLTDGVQSSSGHLVLNTVDAFVGLLAAYLVHGRFVRHARLQDLLVVLGLGLLVVAGSGLNVVVEDLAGVRRGTADVWLPLSVRVCGALLIAGAAIVGPHRRVKLRHPYLAPVLVLAGTVCAVIVLLWLSAPQLPVAFDVDASPSSARGSAFTTHPALVIAQVVAAASLAVAAVLFTRQADECENQLLIWLGPACALGSFARVNYSLFPSLYTDWLYTGDLLRTGFYVLLLVGAAREIERYWADQAHLAVLDDRRRLARELHDGVIQELSFIRSQTQLLATDPASVGEVRKACDRGLEEARAAVTALGAAGDESLSSILERAVRQLGEQYQVALDLDLDDGVQVADAEERHGVVRIAREAVSNAVRHGGGRRIEVALGRGPDGRHLVVRDDGKGFDVAAARSRPTGYGLVSMHDRALGLGGQLEIDSAPGSGSEVTLTW